MRKNSILAGFFAVTANLAGCASNQVSANNPGAEEVQSKETVTFKKVDALPLWGAEVQSKEAVTEPHKCGERAEERIGALIECRDGIFRNMTAMHILNLNDQVLCTEGGEETICTNSVSYTYPGKNVSDSVGSTFRLECVASMTEIICERGQLADLDPEQFGLLPSVEERVKVCVPKGSSQPKMSDALRGDMTVKCVGR